MKKILSLVSVLLLAVACGGSHSDDRSTQGPTPGVNGSFIIASDDTICTEGGRKVYYQPVAPGFPAICYCADRVGRDTGATPETSNLIVYRPAGTTYVVTGITKGSGVGKWNDSWSAAGCP